MSPRDSARDSAREDVYTHGHHESVLRSHRWRTAENSCAYLLPHLRPDMAVLDVGCGPGSITADLAGRVASVLGVDSSGEAIAAARADHPGIEFRVADLFDLDGRYDVVHAAPTTDTRLRSLDLVADAWGLQPQAARAAARP